MMELLGNKHNPHTRPLPGRWTPFQNLMSRCRLPCAKCNTDTISLASEVQYDGLLDGASTPHTSRGYHADVSNLTSSTEDRRIDGPRLNPGGRQESTVTDSDLPSSRSNNHLGLVFSPGRRAQLSRQQMSWMQALSKNNINTPPSLRDAQFLQTSSDFQRSQNSNDSAISQQRDENLLAPEIPRQSPPRSPASNISTEQTRVSITQHLLTDPSSDETDQSPLQSTIVDVYSLHNGNTMFNLDESSNVYSGSLNSPQSSTDSITFIFPENNPPMNSVADDQITSQCGDPDRSINGSESVFQAPAWQRGDSDENTPSLPGNSDVNEINPTHSNGADNFTNEIWSSDTNDDARDVANDQSADTDETTIGTSQESAEETVLLDYSENFTFNPVSSQNNTQLTSTEQNNDVSEGTETNGSHSNVTGSRHDGSDSRHLGSQSNGDSSSERNLPVHLLSLFENPVSNSDFSSTTHSQNTAQTEPVSANNRTYQIPDNTYIPSTHGATFTQPFPRLNHPVLNPNNQDRWATRIIRSNSNNSNSQATNSNSSSTRSRTQLQNWYVYDPRLVPGNRQMPRLNLEMQYRGIQQLWSMPSMIGPPDYDDLSTLQSENGGTNDAMRPSEPPPPYISGGIPPPTYDEAIFDSLFAEDDIPVLGLDNPVYVDPSPPPTIFDINTPVNLDLNRPSTLPCELVLQQLENVLNLNSTSPIESPGDTLTSCATQPSQQDLNDVLGDEISNDSQRSYNFRNRISSIPTYFPENHATIRNPFNSPLQNDHSVPLQSLRSALSAHLQSLNNTALFDANAHQTSFHNAQQNHEPIHAHRNRGGTNRSAGNIQNYFNRPAIMYNRSVWSESHARNNFGLGNRLSTYNSSPDVSQIH